MSSQSPTWRRSIWQKDRIQSDRVGDRVWMRNWGPLIEFDQKLLSKYCLNVSLTGESLSCFISRVLFCACDFSFLNGNLSLAVLAIFVKSSRSWTGSSNLDCLLLIFKCYSRIEYFFVMGASFWGIISGIIGGSTPLLISWSLKL